MSKFDGQRQKIAEDQRVFFEEKLSTHSNLNIEKECFKSNSDSIPEAKEKPDPLIRNILIVEYLVLGVICLAFFLINMFPSTEVFDRIDRYVHKIFPPNASPK